MALSSREKKKLDETQKIPDPPPHLGGLWTHDGTVVRESLCPAAQLLKVVVVGEPLSRQHPPQVRLENIGGKKGDGDEYQILKTEVRDCEASKQSCESLLVKKKKGWLKNGNFNQRELACGSSAP